MTIGQSPGTGALLPNKLHTCRKLYTEISLPGPAAGGSGKAISCIAGTGPLGRVGAVSRQSWCCRSRAASMARTWFKVVSPVCSNHSCSDSW